LADLSFRIEGAEIERFAAAPFINFRVAIDCRDAGRNVRNVMLQCQIRIESSRRAYAADEKSRLSDLFGEPQHWNRTLQGLLWTHASALVPAFERSCLALLPVPCSFDFNVAATKYFHGLAGGDVPLLLLFSGTVFYDDGQGLQISQIAWDQEVRYHLPVALWQQMMDHYYPDSAYLRLPRDVFGRLARYKRQQGLTGWEQALERLLDAHEPRDAPETFEAPGQFDAQQRADA
jgi:hypothetical protein